MTARREAGFSVEMPGKVKNVLVRVGDEAVVGDVLVQLDTADLELILAIAQQNLRLQETNLADLLAEPEATDVAAAEAAVKSAKANLDDLLDGPSAKEIAALDANLHSSQASVASASAFPALDRSAPSSSPCPTNEREHTLCLPRVIYDSTVARPATIMMDSNPLPCYAANHV